MNMKYLIEQIRARAAQLPEYAPDHSEKVSFKEGDFIVRCRPTRDACLNLANRLERGQRRNYCATYKKTRTLKQMMARESRLQVLKRYQHDNEMVALYDL